jgi:hypothetical protein
MNMKRSLPTRRLMALACFALFAMVASPVLGADSSSKAETPSYKKLFEYLPTDSASLAVIDVQAVRGSPYFDRATDYLKSQGRVEGLSKLLSSDTKAVENQSVDRVAVGFPATSSRSTPERSTAILQGTFSESSMKSLFTSEVEGFSTVDIDDELKGYQKDDTVAVLLDDSHLLVVKGASSYRDRALNTARGKAKSLADGSLPTRILQHLDTSKGVWMINNSSSLPKAASEGIVEMGLALGVQKTLDIQAVFRSDSEEAAKELEAQLAKAGSEHAGNSMVEMLGIGPLLSNLKQRREGLIVVATTSMTSSEVDTLIERLEQVVGQMGNNALPIPGRSPGSDESADSTSEDASSDDDGAEADFN